MKKLNETLKMEMIKDPTLCKETQKVSKGWSINAKWPADGVQVEEFLYSSGDWPGEIFAYHSPNEQEKLKVETVKIMYFGKQKRCSAHLHRDKDEYFINALGQFRIEYILKDATKCERILNIGEKMFIPKMMPHTIHGLQNVNILVEVSTLDKPEDSYRIFKGD